MTDIAPIEEVEARIRRVFAVKADTMASGDGAEWEEVRAVTVALRATQPARRGRVLALSGVAAVVVVVLAAGLVSGLSRGPEVTPVTAGSHLPYLLFDDRGLTPGRAPIAAWSTRPVASGLQEYTTAAGRRFRWIGFSQKLTTTDTALPTVIVMATDASDDEFNRVRLG